MLKALGAGLRAWWREILEYALLNLVWVGSLLTIVGGPPATAAMYQMALHSASHDYVGFRPYFRAMRRLFLAAWHWALVQLLIYGVVGFNLIYYAYVAGDFWTIIRTIWVISLMLWSAINVFFWPFYLRQDDQRLTTTYRNILILFAREPLLSLGITVMVVVILLVSVATGILLAFGMMALVALFSTFAVQVALEDKN